MNADQMTLAGGCGICYIYNFQSRLPSRYQYDYATRRSHLVRPEGEAGPINVQVGGTGVFIAAFVPTPECKKMYEELTSKYKLVFQTPARRNNNSGRQFITCVFDRSKAKKNTMTAIEAKWPFKGV
jgi:hypothetical protein